MNRRDLFKAFMVTAAAAGVEKVQAVEVPENALFVLRHPGILSATACERILKSWDRLFFSHDRQPPPLVILEEGMTLEVFSAKRTNDTTITVNRPLIRQEETWDKQAGANSSVRR